MKHYVYSSMDSNRLQSQPVKWFKALLYQIQIYDQSQARFITSLYCMMNNVLRQELVK